MARLLRFSLFSATALMSAVIGCGDSAAPATQNQLVDDQTGGGEIGTPIAAVAVVDPPVTGADVASEVSCLLEDAEGKTAAAPGFTFTVTPDDDVSVAGVEIRSDVPGTRQVLCAFDAHDGLAQRPADWEVTAGGAAKVELYLDPEQASYPLDTPITVKIRTYDGIGNVASDDAEVAQIKIEPAPGTHVEGATIKFTVEGKYTVSASSTDAPEVFGTIAVIADGTPPKVQILTPQRGHTADGPATFMVFGQATDDLSPIASVTVSGQETQVDQDGNFTLNLDAEYGINRVMAVATDTAGNEGFSAHSALWTSEWYPMAPPALETDGIKDGLQIMLGEEGMNDVGALVSELLKTLDLQALLGTAAIGDFLGCEYYLIKFAFTDPEVKLTLHEGAIKAQIVLKDLKVHMKNSGVNKATKIQCTLNNGGDDGPLWATGPLKFEADKMVIDATIELGAGKDGPEVKVTVDDVQFENMWGIDLPLISDVIDWAIETFVSIIKPLIVDLLNGAFTDLLKGFALNTSFDLPSLSGGEPNEVALATTISHIVVTEKALRVSLTAMASAMKSKRPHEVLGAPSYVGCAPVAALPDAPWGSMMLALHDDLLNHILFGVWDGGTLSGTLDPSALGDFDLSGFGITELNAQIDAVQPLIFNSCGDDRLEIGDLWIEADMDFGGTPTKIGIWVQGDVPVTLTVATGEDGGQKIGFQPGELTDMVIEVIINEGAFETDNALLITAVKGLILPQLIKALSGGLASFPLPKISLDSIAPGLQLSLGLETIETVEGTLRAEGKLSTVVVEPPMDAPPE